MNELDKRVLLAAEYMENGDPYKDAIGESDIRDLIEREAHRIKQREQSNADGDANDERHTSWWTEGNCG